MDFVRSSNSILHFRGSSPASKQNTPGLSKLPGLRKGGKTGHP